MRTGALVVTGLFGLGGMCALLSVAARPAITTPAHVEEAPTAALPVAAGSPDESAQSAASVRWQFLFPVPKETELGEVAASRLGMAAEIHRAASRAGRREYFLADWSANGMLEPADLEMFLAAFRESSTRADMNGDGRVDIDDLQTFMRAFVAAEWRHVTWC